MIFNFAGDIDQAMAVLLGFTGRIGIFGITITAFIVTLITFEWGIGLVRMVIKAINPLAHYESEGNALDLYENQYDNEHHYDAHDLAEDERQYFTSNDDFED